MPCAVPIEDRFNVEYRSDRRRKSADTAGPLEEIQVIYSEVLAGVLHCIVHDLRGLPDRNTLPAQFCCLQGQQRVSETAALRIHNMNKSVRELLHKFNRRSNRGIVCAADSRAHRNVNDVLSALKNRGEMREEKLGVQKAGPYFAAVSEPLIVSVPVKVIDIAQIDLRLTVNCILTRQKRDPIQQ